MGFEGFRATMTSCRHERSKSSLDIRETGEDSFGHDLESSPSPELNSDMEHSDECITRQKKLSSNNAKVQSSLRQDIMQLEKRLQEQIAIRCALEKALGYRCTSQNTIDEIPMPKPATDLIREIAVLEFEVGNLEKYLLSLYRKAFDLPISSSSPPTVDDKPKSPPRGRLEFSKPDVVLNCEKSDIQSNAQNGSSNTISLAEHLGTHHILKSPNRLSEDMIKCMCTIYCKLADPPRTSQGLSSPSSSSFSSRDQCENWSSSFDVQLDNPFHVEGLKEFSGPYTSMIEVQCIYRDSQKLSDIEPSLQNYKSLISRLEEMEPRKLTHEEKLAFWINVHNALVMHAFLAYGVPQNSMKRSILLLKASYNIGGHVVSADAIQNSILGCRLPRPGQWVRLLLSSRNKFKAGDERQQYVIEHPEPLVHFALCSGNHSDPAVRLYTPKRIFQELETAKEEYIRANFGVRRDQKILLPKIVESFAKNSGLCSSAGVLQILQQSLPNSLKKNVERCLQGKARKNIEWAPYCSTFRYLVPKELAE